MENSSNNKKKFGDSERKKDKHLSSEHKKDKNVSENKKSIKSIANHDNKLNATAKKRKCDDMEEGEIDDEPPPPLKTLKPAKTKMEKPTEKYSAVRTEDLYIDKSIDTELPEDIFNAVRIKKMILRI